MHITERLEGVVNAAQIDLETGIKGSKRIVAESLKSLAKDALEEIIRLNEVIHNMDKKHVD